MDIYIDIVFAINSVMNFTIFLLVAKLLKLRPKSYRLWLGAGVSGALYCVLLVVFTQYFNFITGIGTLLVGLGVAFGRVSRKQFGLMVLYAHVVAVLIGGGTLAMYSYLHMNFFGIMENFSLSLMAGSTLLIFVGLKFGAWQMNQGLMSRRKYYQVSIYQGEYVISLNTLVDTGNSLVEPMSGMPVMLAEQGQLQQLLTTNLLEEKWRLIPYKTVGKEGVLFGFKPDKIEIKKENETLTLEKVIVGLCDFELSKQGNYRGLLNPVLLEVA